ncbi:TIGR02253 family HAD-type hydrolase [Candidatus Micrarchaeota archaeon]|nr:TIGR02253 family HAD-type hydrolase [Candidatus Micrarchaeota archaeon]
MPLKAILFDLDNTLIDFMKFKKETSKAAAKAMIFHGLPSDEKTIYKRIFQIYDEYGIEYQKTFFRVITPFKLEINKAERIQQAAILAYLKKKFSVLKPYASVKPILRRLRKKYKLAIVTDAPRNKAWQRLVLCGLEDYFDLVITYNDTKEKKPSSKPFKKALSSLKLKPSEILFIGDNPGRDVKGAKSLGMKTALAFYGLTRGKSRVKPDYILKRFEDILKVVK